MPISGHVLVLNQNYEPITICTLKKAIILVVLNKVEVILNNDGRYIQGVSLRLPCPSIVRLLSMVHRNRNGVNLSRKNIMKRDGFQCQYCGVKHHPLTVDHIIPKVKGGKDTWENLVTACIHCNNKKSDLTPAEAHMTLLKNPRKPHPLYFIHSHIGTVSEQWKPYLFLS